MTHTEQAKFIGLTAYVNYDGMLFKAKVIDVRQAYNDTQVLLVPVWGDEDIGYIGKEEQDRAEQIQKLKGVAWKSTGSVRFA